MEKDLSLEKAIEIIDRDIFKERKTVELCELLNNYFAELKKKITSQKYLELSEYPNENNMGEILLSYENDTDNILKVLSRVCSYDENNLYNDEITKSIYYLLRINKNEKDKYGYIWRHLSNYPILLMIYTLGLIYLRKGKYLNLYNLFKIDLEQRYFDGHNIEKFNTTLIEGVNAFHLFNNIDNISVDIYQYIPKVKSDSKTSDVKSRLNANERIYNLLKKIILPYFMNDENLYSNYFDLFEFIVGLFVMDIRIEKESTILFGPYGRRYWLYSAGSSHYLEKDTLVHKFIESVHSEKNNFLKADFFGGSLDRFNKALKEYQALLRRIYY